jgi:UDP-glucuronate 4-epimerase
VKILVTGAAGFIGSAIAHSLHVAGNDVTGLDSFSPYYSLNLKLFRKSELIESQRIKFDSLDLSEKAEVKKYFASNEFDAVIHLAAQPGVRLQTRNWDFYTRDNLEAFNNILMATLENKISNFLYASSSSVYGNSTQESFSEKSTNVQPVSFYGATKLSNEILASACSKNSELKTRGLRFFTVYGPWGRPDMVYFRMVYSALSGLPFNFYGTGDVRRDFTYIDDVVSSVSALTLDLSHRETGFSDVVNIGGGKPISINECLRIIEEAIGSQIPYNRKDADPRDVELTNADFSYLNQITGNFPKTSASQGFANFISWATRPDIKSRLAQWVNSVQ